MSIFVKYWFTCMTKVASGRKKWPLASTSISLGMSQLWGFATRCDPKKCSSNFVNLDFCKISKTILMKEISSPDLIRRPKFMKFRSKVVQSMHYLWYYYDFWQKNRFNFQNHGARKHVFSSLISYCFGKAKSPLKMHTLLICLMDLRSEILQVYILWCPRKLSRPWTKVFSKIRIFQFSPDETACRSFHPRWDGSHFRILAF